MCEMASASLMGAPPSSRASLPSPLLKRAPDVAAAAARPCLDGRRRSSPLRLLLGTEGDRTTLAVLALREPSCAVAAALATHERRSAAIGLGQLMMSATPPRGTCAKPTAPTYAASCTGR
jgi:hypothetical protein